MSHYGITAIRWNTQHTEVESCMVHEVIKDGSHFALLDGEPMEFYRVASLISGGDKVWAMEKGADNKYDKRGSVLVKAGQQEYLYSHDNSFFDLPTF